MGSRNPANHRLGASAPGDDCAVTVLQQLEGERGRLFSETEYQQMRRTVLEELALGAQRRPFTLFTFAVVGLVLCALLAAGVMTHAQDTSGDLALVLVSGAALAVAGYLFWSYLRSIRVDGLRSLDERLGEVEQLRSLGLISREEYEYIHSNILISRQQACPPARPIQG